LRATVVCKFEPAWGCRHLSDPSTSRHVLSSRLCADIAAFAHTAGLLADTACPVVVGAERFYLRAPKLSVRVLAARCWCRGWRWRLVTDGTLTADTAGLLADTASPVVVGAERFYLRAPKLSVRVLAAPCPRRQLLFRHRGGLGACAQAAGLSTATLSPLIVVTKRLDLLAFSLSICVFAPCRRERRLPRWCGRRITEDNFNATYIKHLVHLEEEVGPLWFADLVAESCALDVVLHLSRRGLWVVLQE